jgi:hypothetical protein
MIKIPSSMLAEFKGCYDTHKVNIAACNIFYETIKMLNLNKKHNIVTRDMYRDIFMPTLSDIELVTPPTDAFIPGEGTDRLFSVNQLAPEYIEITKRIPLSLIEATFDPTSELVMTLKEDPNKLIIAHDDIFIYYNLFKYLDQIDIIRLSIFSNYTPVIEYIIDNITLEDWQDYIKTNRINDEKYAKKCEDLIFNPDIKSVYNFYMTNAKAPNFDIVNLLKKLVSNTVLNTDIYIILGVYITLMYAMADFNNEKAEDSKCAIYVKEVLSKL